MGAMVTETQLRQGYIPFLEYYLKIKYDEKPKPKFRKRKFCSVNSEVRTSAGQLFDLSLATRLAVVKLNPLLPAI